MYGPIIARPKMDTLESPLLLCQPQREPEHVSAAEVEEFQLVAQTYFCDSRSPLCSPLRSPLQLQPIFHTRSPLRSRLPDFWPTPLPFRSNVSNSKLKNGPIFIQRNVQAYLYSLTVGKFHNFANKLSQQLHH